MQRREAAWTDKALKHYGARLLNMLEARPNLAPEKTNELAPRNLPLSQEATELWRQFSDQTEMDIGPVERPQLVRHLGNKIPEHAARLAGVLQLTDDLHAGAIKR